MWQPERQVRGGKRGCAPQLCRVPELSSSTVAWAANGTGGRRRVLCESQGGDHSWVRQGLTGHKRSSQTH